jgi:hypothetical protein
VQGAAPKATIQNGTQIRKPDQISINLRGEPALGVGLSHSATGIRAGESAGLGPSQNPATIGSIASAHSVKRSENALGASLQLPAGLLQSRQGRKRRVAASKNKWRLRVQ